MLFQTSNENDLNTLTQPVLASKEIREIEKHYLEIYKDNLMFMAASEMAVVIKNSYPNKNTSFICFAGSGNNGGDGYAVATDLIKNGYVDVNVIPVLPQKKGAQAEQARDLYLQNGGKEILFSSLISRNIGKNTVIIDAITGIGVTSKTNDPEKSQKLITAVEFINKSSCEVVSLDLPSLLNSDTGIPVYQVAVKATMTITVFALKLGLFLGQAKDYTGTNIVVLDNLPGFKKIMESYSLPNYRSINYQDIKSSIPVRSRCAHKGDAGKVLIVGGQQTMEGALIIAGRGALRSGAGLIALISLSGSHISQNAIQPELMSGSIKDLDSRISWADCVVMGPGIGASSEALGVARTVFSKASKLVVDADGLRLLKRIFSFPRLMSQHRPEILILTPHLGEAAMLLDSTVSDVIADPLGAATKIAEHYGALVIMKSATTVISNGEQQYIVSTGSPGMASGGMGDLLSGMVGTFIAQKNSPVKAAILAVTIHGEAGHCSEVKYGAQGMCASDLLEEIRLLVNSRE